MDGKTLTEFLHRNGVNCRYLGRLAVLAKEEELKDEKTEADLKQGKLTVVERRTMPKCWLELLECEMVARAAKHVLDSYLTEHGGVASMQPAQTIASFLSALVSDREETAAQTETRLEKRPASLPDEDDISALTITGTGGDDDSGAVGIRGRYEVWQDIEAEVGRRFRYTLYLSNTGNKTGRALYIPLLRRVCQRTGVRIIARNYDVGGKALCSGGSTLGGHLTESYPISPLDIVDVVPLMKHAASYSEGFSPCSVGPSVSLPALQVSLRDARLALERAHLQTSGRALGKGLELAQEAASLYQRVTDNAAHPGVIESIDLMATIFLEAGDPEMAAANGSKALALSIQSGGFDTANVFSSHMTLFQMYYAARDFDRAIKHLHAAIYVLEIMAGPRHTENFTAYHKLGSVYSHDDYNGKYLSTALKFLEEAINRHSCDRLMDGITAKTLAKVLAGVGEFKEAVDAEKKAFQVLSMFLGREHQLTKDSDTELQNYMKLAVDKGSRQVESDSIRAEEAKAEAVAAALSAEEEKKVKKNNKKKKGKK
jgi:protein TIF31